MNQELERKFEKNEELKALFMEYKKKETKIKNMLKEYEKAKEEGVSSKELLLRKKAIKVEQMPLLESFYQYKELENKIVTKKQEVKDKTRQEKERQVEKSLEKKKNRQEERPLRRQVYKKVTSNQLAEIKVVPIDRKKAITQKTKMAEIIPISKKRSIEKSKSLNKSTNAIKAKRKTIKRPFVAKENKTLKSNVVTLSRMAKNRNHVVNQKRSKLIKHNLKRKWKAIQKFLGWNKSQNTKKRKIETPTQKRQERQFTMIDMYRGTVQNEDGHIEANANKKIKEMPKKEDDNQLHVIGW